MAEETIDNHRLEVAKRNLEEYARDLQIRAIGNVVDGGTLRESWATEDQYAWPRTQADRTRPRNPHCLPSRGDASLYDNENGKFHPFYETEQDLWHNLSVCRNLFTYDSVTIGTAQSLRSYVLTGEWVINSEERGEEKSDLAKSVTRAINEFLDANQWFDVILPDIHDEARKDGERFICLYPDRDDVLVDLRDPEHCREPRRSAELDDQLGSEGATWHFGIHCRRMRHTNRIDWMRPLGYYFVEDEAGNEWEYCPSWPQPGVLEDERCCVHYKRNARLRSARGVSDYFPIAPCAERNFKTARNLQTGASIQAAIALIVQSENASRSATLLDVQNNAVDTIERLQRLGGSSSLSMYSRNFPEGTIVEASKGRSYSSGPMAAQNAQVYIDVAQFGMRRLGVRWNMPEFLITGDASNANMASSLVAHAPFVKYCEFEQTRLKLLHQEVIWRVLRMMWLRGRFSQYESNWQNFKDRLSIEVTAPEVAPDKPTESDSATKTTRLQTLHTAGIITGKTWARLEEMPEEDVIERSLPATPAGQPSDAQAPGAPAVEPASGAAQDQLNGAQVNAAVDVMVQLRQEVIMPDAAVALLTAIGIPPDKARLMVDQTAAAAPLRRDDQEKVAVAAQATESWREYWRGYP